MFEPSRSTGAARLIGALPTIKFLAKLLRRETEAGNLAIEDTFAAAPQLEVLSVACPRFVEFVEAGITTGPELLATAEEYLQPLKHAGVDTLVLGCTHYPLLPHDQGDDAGEQRVVGAAQDQGVHTGVLERLQVLLGGGQQLRPGGDPCLDELHEPRAGHGEDLELGGGGEGVLIGP